jgi:glycosyltransferase involved in cell wall biosynthesis
MAVLCDASQASTLSTPYQRLLDEAGAIINHITYQQAHNTQHLQDSSKPHLWVVLDADGSQEALPGSSTSLMEACSASFPPKSLLLLVQNIHFLPVGPQGTAARSPALLRSWAHLGGVLCVSSFVARYVAQHAMPLGLPPQRIYCIHYAAFKAFGSGPFTNYGTAAAAQLLPWTVDAINSSGSGVQQGGQQAHGSISHNRGTPIVGCLKLSPEKGGVLFLDLARALPQLHFLAVCADPTLQAAAAQLPNVRTTAPGDVQSLLQHMTVLLAPSLWQEAYGMVVTDALLRGVPVIVSDQGGLEEAALGCAAAVVPVNPMQLPEAGSESAGFRPSWQARVLPAEQDVAGWAQALQRLLGDRGMYESCSQSGWDAAQRLVQHQRQLLEQLVEWLTQLS